jgi:hypothetical protein
MEGALANLKNLSMCTRKLAKIENLTMCTYKLGNLTIANLQKLATWQLEKLGNMHL